MVLKSERGTRNRVAYVIVLTYKVVFNKQQRNVLSQGEIATVLFES